jgi:hypothetical protein
MDEVQKPSNSEDFSFNFSHFLHADDRIVPQVGHDRYQFMNLSTTLPLDAL